MGLNSAGYPFSTFLFWELDPDHVTAANYFYIFARECNFKKNGDNKGCTYATGNIDFTKSDHPTIAVLDGQQRLTSLFLSLYGDVWKEPRKNSSRYMLRLFLELDSNKIDEHNEFNAKKYGVFFSDRDPSVLSHTAFEVKQLLNEEFKDPDTRAIRIEEIVQNVPETQRDYATDVLNRLCNAFYENELVTYTKISELSQDDALEMFVRFNSGGKPLSKAQISMSILEVYWPDVKNDFIQALSGNFSGFGTDFILRAGHMIYGDVVESNIDGEFALAFKDSFGLFKAALKNTSELFEMANYDLTKFASKWNVVIPIVYLVYNNPNYIDCIEGVFAYLFRSILFNYFSSGTTSKLQKLRNMLMRNNFRFSLTLLDADEDLRVTTAKIDDLFVAQKGSSTVGNILYCLGLTRLKNDTDYDEDHIHPESRFGSSRPLGMSDEDWSFARSVYNALPNLQLLEASKNRSKGDTDFNLYYLNDLTREERNTLKNDGFIPDPPVGISSMHYYSIGNCKAFFQDRKVLLTEQIKALLNGQC